MTLLLSDSSIAAGKLNIRLVSEFKTAFNWKTDRCADDDIPDGPLRVFQSYDDKIVGLATHYNAYLLSGVKLSSLRRQCQVVMNSQRNPIPSKFLYLDWLYSIWTADGRHIDGLIHSEFHANEIPGSCSNGSLNGCWLNAIKGVSSPDGLGSFGELRLIIAPPVDDSRSVQKKEGAFMPSNMIRVGGYIYTLIYVKRSAGEAGVCEFRRKIDTRDWEYYSGSGWSEKAVNQTNDCKFLSGLSQPAHSIVKHRPTNQFIMLSTRTWADRGEFVYWTSRDLIEWQFGGVLDNLPVVDQGCTDSKAYQYPSMLSPEPVEHMFDMVDENAYIFFTRFNLKNCQKNNNRDLVFIEVKLE